MRAIVMAGVLGLVGVGGCSSQEPMFVDPWFTHERQRAEPARVIEYLTGSFSSAAQAANDPDNYHDIRLEMVRIWPDRSQRDHTYIYVEQAAAAALDRPYRQRVYHVFPESGVMRSVVYTLPDDPLPYAGWWRTPERFDGAFGPDDLVRRDGCAIKLTWDEAQQAFVGSTEGNGCASSLAGASYATSEVLITADGMRTWDRGFDGDGNQVWGATKGPYQFDRVR